MSVTRKKMMEILRVKYPKLFIRTTEEFDGSEGGIWSSGENGEEAKDGFRLFDYYAEDYNEVRYQIGVHNEIRKVLEKNGWFAEWYDPGTIMFYES